MNRYALSFLNRQHSTNIQYTIENIQSLKDGECIPIQFFATKCIKIITKVLKIVTYCIITESANQVI